MEVFETHRSLIEDYAAFTDSLVEVRDEKIKDYLERERAAKVRWPDPWISLNPAFASGGTVDELVGTGLLHPDCGRFFRVKRDSGDPGGRSLTLYRHQREAIEAARDGSSYVLTTGTGSGKSLSYIVPVVDSVLRDPRPNRISAIVVYPMNALANSQLHELKKYLEWGIPVDGRSVTFDRYTGQDLAESRQRILDRRPDILLTNYVMLEYILTRPHERQALIGAAAGLRFLVLDELHTYRGRQGADVALLTRRLRDACEAPDMQCVGTSATMSRKASFEEMRREVAVVAGRLFGTEVRPDRVIGETLERATAWRPVSDVELRARVIDAEPMDAEPMDAEPIDTEPIDTEPMDAEPPVRVGEQVPLDPTGAPPPSGGRSQPFARLAGDPLAIWVEDTFGLALGPGDRLVREDPTTLAAAAEKLAERTDLPVETCAGAIQAMLVEGAAVRHPEHGRPLFAFRLHQFLSKGDTVHVSLEPTTVRYITSQYQVSVPGSRDKVLLPLAFCRECGQEYLVVARSRDTPRRYTPRRESAAVESEVDLGYLYVSEDHPWPADPIAEGCFPDTWFDVDEHGHSFVLPRLADQVPRRVRVTADGSEVETDGERAVFLRDMSGSGASGSGASEPMTAWFIPAPFRFCLRCRVSYEQLRAQDFAKLASFAAEGRSSAVSLVSTSIVRNLRRQKALDSRAKKLLTFVDNRQDASLQAGHLNDFVQVTQLRGALYRAARAAGPAGLRFDSVAERVTDALDLPMRSFSAIEEPVFSQRDNVLRALRAAIGYRVYADLERGWRVTMPNLEQTGLITFDYVDLDEIAQHQASWAATHALLRDDDPEHRALLARILLDEMRRALAVDVDALTQPGHERIVQTSDHLLRGVWAVSGDEPRVLERTAYPFPGGRGGMRDAVHVTGRGAFGRYLRRPHEFPRHRGRIRLDDAEAVIHDLFTVLERHGLIGQVMVTGPARGGARAQRGPAGYRVKASALIWRAGNGRRGAEDPLRRVVDDTVGARVNPFFRDLYSHAAAELAGIVAREHTAQVRAQQRQDREEAFRRGGDPAEGGLPLLYCSPTMELGVDIADLNAVMMRNVPPTPANYAQRSGRAGRGGQPALVTTYCSTGSAHDQYYFRRSKLMVAGRVTLPRLDLANEDLVRSHVHAIWLAESGASLHRGLTDVLDTAEGPRGELPLPIREDLAAHLDDPAVRARTVRRAEAVLAEETKNSPWWYDRWIPDVVNGAFLAFDGACDRWRAMYRQAIADQREQNRRVLDRSTQSKARAAARRRRYEAEQRLYLLTNDSLDQQLFSDFYSYRYFASEGFLPGYSFPRLPLAAYIPGSRRGDGSYIQRPRFIAVGEFGPGALIYHEGGRYQVTSVQVPGSEHGVPGSVATIEARLCESCGYWHHRDAAVNRCEECGVALGGGRAGLMHLQTVTTTHRRRISSDEEERRRAGFDLLTTFRFSRHGVRPGRLAADVRGPDGEDLAEFVYGDTATIRIINQGLRRRADKNDVGYWLDTVNGRWLNERRAGELRAGDLTEEESGLDEFADDPRARKIIPYVEDRRNIAVVRLARPVSDEVATSVRYALERGIEALFQLEDAELESQRLPDPDGRGRMLFVESAEGGAGVLRRLHDEPEALAEVAQEALRIVHFDPKTGADTDRAPGARERCERGCYDCLLSYGNQSDHTVIDRHAAVEILRALTAARTEPRHGHAGGAEGHAEALRERAGSGLERQLVTFLREEGYRLPDATQMLVSDAAARPDFVYRLPSGAVAVFVDGPHHDAAAAAARDADAEDRLADLGWLVVRFRYDAEWGEIVAHYPNVFGPGRRG